MVTAIMHSGLEFAFASAFSGTDLPGGRFWRHRTCAPVFLWSELAAATVLAARVFLEARERLASVPIGEGKPPYGNKDADLCRAAKRTVSATTGLWDSLATLASSVGDAVAEEAIYATSWGSRDPGAYAWDLRDASKVPMFGAELMTLFTAAVDGVALVAAAVRNRTAAATTAAAPAGGGEWLLWFVGEPGGAIPTAARASLALGMELVRGVLALALPSAGFSLPEDVPDSVEEDARVFASRLSLSFARERVPEPTAKFEEEEDYYLRCLRAVYEIDDILSRPSPAIKIPQGARTDRRRGVSRGTTAARSFPLLQ